MLLFRHRITARFRDCDALGHVNHAAFLTYCEQARFALWRVQLDFVVAPHGTAPPKGSVPGFILARVEIDYRAQVRYGDELEVRLSLGGLGRTSFVYLYDVVSVASDRLVANAKTVLVLFDYTEQRPVPIDEPLRARLSNPVEP